LVTGISNPSSGGITDSTITEVLNNITSNTVPVTYSIIPSNKGCTGDPFFYSVSIKPTPAAPVISNSTPVCAGTPLNLFTNTIAGAGYQWTGPNGFSSVQQNPVLTNVTTASAGIYQLTISVNKCSSSPSSKNIAPVIAAPAANSNSPLCEQSRLQLTAGGLAGASYSWKGPAGFSSAVQNPFLNSVSPSNAGMYYVTASIAGCTGLTDSVAVTVNIPPAKPQVFSNSPVCTSDSITLNASNITANASLQWSGPGGFKSSLPTLTIPRAEKTNEGEYNLTVSTQGCAVTNAAATSVLVNQRPQINSIGNNGPVCEGGTLILNATSLPGAVFSWSSLSGYSATAQNPAINNVTKSNQESYRAVVTLNGCASDTAVTNVLIVKAAIADPGSSRVVCANNASVTLAGIITGEDTQTGTWSSDGAGSFLPNANQLSAMYVPDKTDTARRKVTLTLTTSNNKVCPVQSSRIDLTILPAPVVNAGPDQSVCSNDSLVTLQGMVANAGGANWLSSGSGVFRQSSSSLNNIYVPSRQDIQRGTVSFYLRSSNNGNCFVVSDTAQYRIQPIPFVNAGNDMMVFENEPTRLSPTVTGNGLQFLWTPAIDLSSATVQNPILTPKTNQEYTIQVTGTGSCTVSDKLLIRVLKPFIIPNIFTPNGDGVHDVWSIPELANYPGASVEIFTRGGMKIFSSVGYERPWDGTYNGQPVPVATYYYIIRPNFRDMLFSGSVTIVR
jgi:gliding motility-associated-like protein